LLKFYIGKLIVYNPILLFHLIFSKNKNKSNKEKILMQ